MAEETAMTAVQAVPEGAKAVTKFTAEHGKEINMPSPEALNYMSSIANMLSDSALVTKDVVPEGVHPDLKPQIIKANMMAKMLVGHKMGMDPIQSLQEIFIVKGKIFIGYPQLIAQMEAKGKLVEEVERSNTRAALVVKRQGRADQTFEFTIEDAATAGLTSSRGNEPSQFIKRPRVMLWARCVSEAYRATGGQGNIYDHSERKEIEDSDRAERGDGSSTVFAEHARETNPYNVGSTAAPEAAAPAEPTPVKDTVVDIKPAASTPSPAAPAAQPAPVADAPVATTPPPPAQSTAPAPRAPASNLVQMPAPAATPAQEPPSAPLLPEVSLVQMPNPEPAAEVKAEPVAAVPVEDPPAPTPPPPAAVKPDAPAATPSKSPLRQRLSALTDYVDKLSPIKVESLLVQWLCGYFGLAKPSSLPVNPDLYDTPLRLLEAVLKDESSSGKSALVANPKESGGLVGTGWRSLLATMDEWSWSEILKLKMVAVIVAMQHAPSGGVETKEWLEFHGVEKLVESDADTFLDLALRVGGDANKLIKLSSALKVRPYELVKRWAIDINTAPKEGIMAFLNQDPASAAKATPAAVDEPAPPPPAVEAAPEEEPFDMSMFDLPEGT